MAEDGALDIVADLAERLGAPALADVKFRTDDWGIVHPVTETEEAA